MHSVGEVLLTPRTSSSVSRAVSNVSSVDGSVTGRIHFAEKPENAYLRKLINGTSATAVTWDIQGLPPYATFELHVREFGDLRRGNLSTGNSMTNVLTMGWIVICGGESGWRYRMKEVEDSESCRDLPLLIADGHGKAQGVSIERGLRVHDVLGRMIVIQEIEFAKTEEKGCAMGTIIRRGRPVLGVIGCQRVRQ